MTMSHDDQRRDTLAATLLVMERRGEFFDIVSEAANPDEARDTLRDTFSLSELAATHVLGLELRKLTKLGMQRVRSQLAELTGA